MNIYRKTPLFIFCLLVIGFASCNKGNKVTPPGTGKNLVLTSYEQQKVTADNAFAIRLYKNLDGANAPGTNLFISPLSVSFALGMTSNGAAGATYTAFQNTLNFGGLTQDQINAYYNNLVTNLPELDPNTTLNIANSIWYRQGFSVFPQFLKTDSSNFQAQIQALDFSNPAAVNTINNWVNNKTSGKIPTIINAIPGDMVMYLINAMYFKSTWKEKFDASQTAPRSFYLPDNSTVQTNFMNGLIDVNSYSDGKESVYELPYSNSKYSMVIVIPAAGTSLKDMVSGLDAAKWESWMAGLQPSRATVIMPKYQFTYSTMLNKPLIDLGLGAAFSDTANFTKISTSRPLKISQVIHKAYVATDESGTTAAAVTSVGVVAASAPANAMALFDHPYLFAIRQMSSGIILFVGTMNNPTLSGN
jgi:serpin B